MQSPDLQEYLPWPGSSEYQKQTFHSLHQVLGGNV